jgi:hypothetical protein
VRIFLDFAPYIAFFVALTLVAVLTALWAAAGIAVLITGWNLAREGSAKVLEIGSLVVFAAIASLGAAEHWHWTLMGVRLAVDCGLLLIVLVSLAIDRPFTLRYAHERLAKEIWNNSLPLSINRQITWVWAAAFTALVAAHAAVVFAPGTPVFLDIAVILLALFGGFRFTQRYPKVARRKSTGAG